LFNEGKDTFDGALVSIGFDLLTPALQIQGKPRLFFTADFRESLESDTNLASSFANQDLTLGGFTQAVPNFVGTVNANLQDDPLYPPGAGLPPIDDPSTVFFEDREGRYEAYPVGVDPISLPLLNGCYTERRQPTGVGALVNCNPADIRVNTEGQITRMWTAGIGAAFDTPIERYPVRIRIGLDYMGEQVKMSGQLFEVVPGPGNVPQRTAQKVTERHIYHGIAPSVGLDIEVGRVGPLALSFMFEVQVAYLFGTDRVFLCKNPVVFDAQGQIRECINSTQTFQRTSGRGAFFVDVEPLQVYGGLGFRVAFVGN
jgi:hypothetical protein